MNRIRFKPVVALLLAMTTTELSCPLLASADGLDLTSSARTVPASVAGMSGPTGIRVGNSVRIVTGTDTLTAAEFVAVNQVLSTGNQRLLVDALGRASGGTFLLNSLPQAALSSLTIPVGVTAINNFTANANLRFAQNLVNSGNFFAVSTNQSSNIANIFAANVFNNAGGVLSSVVPTGGFARIPDAIKNLNLNLSASGEIVNAGTISSGGSLGLNSAKLTNSGTIQANSDINISGATTGGAIEVDNRGGRIESTLGNINFGPGGLASSISVRGGGFFSNQLNLTSQGVVDFNVNQISGLVNLTSNGAHFLASTPVLRLGEWCITGDPLIVNKNGDVQLDGSSILSTNGDDLTIAARGNIVTNSLGTLSIDTRSASGNGGNVVIVAGALITDVAGGGISISGASPTGGMIDLSDNSALGGGAGIDKIDTRGTSVGDSDGGHVTLIAFDGTDPMQRDVNTSGKILVNAAAPITTGGTNNGSSGDVLVIAGSHDAGSLVIGIGDVDTTGGAGGFTGGIQIFSSDIVTTNGAVEFDSNGFLTGNSFFTAPLNRSGLFGDEWTATLGGNILTGSLTATGGRGPDIVTDGAVTVLGNITFVPNDGQIGTDATVTLENRTNIQAGSLYVSGSIAAPGSVVDILIDGPLGVQVDGLTVTGGAVSINTAYGQGPIKAGHIVALGNAFSLNIQGNPIPASFADLSSGLFGSVDVGSITAGGGGIQVLTGGTLGSSSNPLEVSTTGGVALFADSVYAVAPGNITLNVVSSGYGGGANDVFDFRTQNNGDIKLFGNPLLLGGGPVLLTNGNQGTVRLTADGSGRIIMQGFAILNGERVELTSGSGDIGVSDTGAGLIPLLVDASELKVSTSGNVFIGNADFNTYGITGSGTYENKPTTTLIDVNVGAGKTFIYDNQATVALPNPNPLFPDPGLRSPATVILPGAIVGDNANLNITSAGTLNVTGDITSTTGGTVTLAGKDILLNADILRSGGGGVVTLTGGPNGAVQNIAGYVIEGGELVLNGNAGTEVKPIRTNAGTLTVNDGEDVFVTRYNDLYGLTLNQVNANTFSLRTEGAIDITVQNVIAANHVSLNSEDGSITVNATINEPGLNLFGRNGTIELIALNGSVENNATLASGSVAVTTDDFTNDGLIVGDREVLISSTPGGDLTIQGVGSITGGSLSFSATPNSVFDNNTVIFASGADQSLNGPATIIANGDFQSVVQVESGASVHSVSPVTIFANGYDQSGTLTAPGAIKLIFPRGVGTLSNTQGDLNLTQNIDVNGHHLAILAKGNITASSNVTKIDMSHNAGHGGHVVLVAGFDFSNGAATANGAAGGHETDYGNLYMVDAPSETGGSIILPKVKITTSSTTTAPESGVSGSVVAVAHGGTTNVGAVLLNDITTSAAKLNGRAGDVTIIGEGGVQVGKINATGAFAGDVTIIGGTPSIQNGPMIFQDGYNRTAATFIGTVSSAKGAAVTTGGIDTTSYVGRAGDVLIESDAAVNVKGNITAKGTKNFDVSSPDGRRGGVVKVSSLENNVTVGIVDVSGFDITAKTNPDNGANAGSILLSSPSTITTSHLKANGGKTAGAGNGGNGGLILVSSTRDLGNDMFGGDVIVRGYVEAKGNNGASAGDGGSVLLTAGSVRVLSKNGAYSINTQPGVRTNAAGSFGDPGAVAITTYSVQSLPTKFDLTSNKAADMQVALPGGKFTVGLAVPKGITGLPNGTVGGIVTNSTTQAINARSVTDTVSGVDFDEQNVQINVVGGGQDTQELRKILNAGPNDYDTPTVHYEPWQVVTPARAVRLYQVTHGGNPQDMFINNETGLAIDRRFGGNPAIARVNVDARDLRSPLSSFKLQAEGNSKNIELKISGALPTLDLSASSINAIRGKLIFNPGENGKAFLILGTRSLPLLPESVVEVPYPNTTLVLTTGATSLSNEGKLAAPQIMLVPTAASFTFTNKSTGIVQPYYFSGPQSVYTDPKLIFTSVGTLPTMTIKNEGGQFNYVDGIFSRSLPISFENYQLPLGAGVAAINSLPLSPSAVRNVNLTFALATPSTGNTFVPQEAHLRGILSGDAVTIKTVQNTFNKTYKPLTDLNLDDVEIATKNGAVSITSAGYLEMTNSSVDAGALSMVMPTKASVKITAGRNINFIDSSVLAYKANEIKTTGGGFVATGDGDIFSFDSTVKITSSSNLALSDSSYIFACTGVSLVSNAGAVDLKGAVYNASGKVDVFAAQSIFTYPSTYVTSGRLDPLITITTSTTTLQSSAVQQKGSIVLTAGTKTNPLGHNIDLAPLATFEAYGGDVSMTAWGDINVSNGASVAANGGNVVMLANGLVRGAAKTGAEPNASIVARAIGTAKASTGGGIEIGSGLTKSTNLAAALKLTQTQLVPTSQLGQFIDYDPGNVGILQIKGDHVQIDLTQTNNPTSIYQRGGAIVIDAMATPNTPVPLVQFDGIDLTTYGFKPIGYASTAHTVGALMQPDSDAVWNSPVATVTAKRNALVSIEQGANTLRVKACSGPGHVTIDVQGQKFDLAPGHEALITKNAPTADELVPSDGVGRRRSSTHVARGGAVVTISEFSMISYIQNADYLNEVRFGRSTDSKKVLSMLLKTAAAVQTTGANRGAYTARTYIKMGPGQVKAMTTDL